MRSINRMIKAVISIMILTLSFAGIPAQAFVQSNDHSCCQSGLNQMVEPMTAMPMTALDTASDTIEIESILVELGCDDCDSPLSCFSIDGASFVLSYPSKMNLGFPKSDSDLSTDHKFITLLVPPEIRPPKV